MFHRAHPTSARIGAQRLVLTLLLSSILWGCGQSTDVAPQAVDVATDGLGISEVGISDSLLDGSVDVNEPDEGLPADGVSDAPAGPEITMDNGQTVEHDIEDEDPLDGAEGDGPIEEISDDASEAVDAAEVTDDPVCTEDSDCESPEDPCWIASCELETGACTTAPHTGALCEDGEPCTAADTCDEEGVCVGSAYGCEGLPCETAQCDGMWGCQVSVLDGECSIDGVCHVDGSTHPEDPCQACAADGLATAWTPLVGCSPPGSACVDGLPCELTEDCGEDSVCIAEACFCYKTAEAGYCPGCLIEELCMEPGLPNPTNACQYCDPGLDGLGWSTIPGCGQLLPCLSGDKCTSDGECGFGVCNGGSCDCQACQEKKGLSCLVGSQCGVGGGCFSKSCSCSGLTPCGGCMIGEACVPKGGLNPSNSCLQCAPQSNPSGWTPTNDGLPCSDALGCTSGDICDGGLCLSGVTIACHDTLACTLDYCLGTNNQTASVCIHGLINGTCLIDGACVAHGASNPDTTCERCEPSLNPFAWSPAPGPGCEPGPACTQDEVCSTSEDCAVEGGLGNGGACVDGFCDCQSWCVTDAGCLDDAECGPGGTCETGACQCDEGCGGCFIDEVCFPDGLPHPSQSCKLCDAAQDALGWTLLGDGTLCDGDGNACTVEDTCQGGQCVVGSLMSCTDAHPCTQDFCVSTSPGSAACMFVPGPTWCVIDGACTPEGTPHPDDPCLICNPQIDPYGWSLDPLCPPEPCVDGDACDDGDACTLDDACQGGVCVGSVSVDCGDNLGCTSDVCQPLTGQCAHQLDPGFCLIPTPGGDVCFPHGATNPGVPCELCDSASQPHAWSSESNGSPCDDGNPCTAGDFCLMGACAGPPVCPTPPANTAPCITPGCFVDVSGALTCNPHTSGCIMGTQCYASGQAHPWNSCQLCDGSVSGFVGMPDGSPCNAGSVCPGECLLGSCQGSNSACPSDGLDCTYDDCVPGDHQCGDLMPGSCLINDVCLSGGATNPQNPCEICDPLVSTGTWSPGNDGASCDLDGCTQDSCSGGSCAVNGYEDCHDGLFCTADSCTSTGPSSFTCNNALSGLYCLFGGLCVPMGTTDANNACMHCNPGASQDQWASKPNGTLCSTGAWCGEACWGGSCEILACADDGDDCTYDDCVPGSHVCGELMPGTCKINGTCYSSGQENPNNPCEACKPLLHVGLWSPHNVGQICDQDGDLCTDEICDAGGSCVVAGGPCSDDGLVCTETCITSGGSAECNTLKAGYCVIDGQCFGAGAQNPDEPCESCSPVLDDEGWSATAEGAPCDLDGDGCTVDECNQGSCQHMQSIDCGDGLECTDDACLSTGPDTYECPNELLPGFCFINGECVDAGEAIPGWSCYGCNPEESLTEWSPLPPCTPCNSGESEECSTDDFCIDGACMQGFLGEDLCDPCPEPDYICTFPGYCVMQLTCYVQGHPPVECSDTHPENPNLICGRGDFYPSCDG